MKSSEILRRAARLIERGHYSYGCGAIVGAYNDPNGVAAEKECWKYFRMCGPARLPKYWWSLEDQGPRIIGLCLAAAVAESEGD